MCRLFAVGRGRAHKLAFCHVPRLGPEVAAAAPVMEPEVPVVPTVLSLCVCECVSSVCAWLSVCSTPGFILF